MTEIAQYELDSILRQVLAVPNEARNAFLDETCGQHTQLRAIVDRMLAACDAQDGPLTPGGALSGPLWNELVSQRGFSGLEAGDRVDAWRIVRTLGQGGMATVYLAERSDGQFEQSVALKILHPSQHADDVARRFGQERQILASLNHPNIAHLIDGGLMPSGEPYVALEYVDGVPIDTYCDRECLGVRERLALFMLLAGAIGYAHRNLVIHRDIKPSNILVTAGGVPKLLDFGIAKLLDESLPHAAPETRSALHPMTPEYASPEQVRGEPLSTASDIYQLGYLLYRLLAGVSPYRVDRRNYAAMIEAICEADPVPPSAARSEPPADGAEAQPGHSASRTVLAGDIDAIVLKALRKEPEARYHSAESLAEDIERYLQGLPVTARQGNAAYQARKFVRRHLWGAGTSLVFALLVAAFGFVYTLQSANNAAKLAQERDAAQLEAAKAERVASFIAGLLDSAKPDRTKGEAVTVLELLEKGGKRVEEELADQPDVQARMLGVIADSYYELGAYDKAREFSRKQLELETRIWGPNDPRLARTLRRLGEHEYFVGDLNAARATLERALTLHAPGLQGDAERGRTLGSLGIVLRALGELDAARAAHEQSLPLVEALGDREYVRQAWQNYGNLLLVTDAYDDAARAYRKALEYHDDLETTRAAGLMANIGMATAAAQRPAEGLVYFERATAVFEKLLPPNHPSLAKLYSATAECLVMLKRYDEAYAMHKHALEIYESALGSNHFEINFALIELGDVFLYTGRPEAAVQYYDRALQVVADSAGDDSINASYAMQKLGTARLRQGNLASAERWLERALPIQQRELGDDHSRVNLTRIRLGIVLLRQGQHEEARSLLGDALRLARRDAGGTGDIDVAAAESAYGEYLLAVGNPGEAEPLLLSSYRIAEDHPDRASVIVALERLQSLYSELGQRGEADRYEALQRRILESLRTLQLGERDP